MKRTMCSVFLVLAVLLSLMLVIAGCASVPAPGEPLVPTPAKTITPTKVTPAVTVSVAKTLRTLAPVATTPLSTTIPPVMTTTPSGNRYSVETCAGAGGFVVNPGERCPGSWMDTTGTFSCCSLQPVPDTPANLTVVSARPLNLRVNLSDDPGSIVP